MPPPSNTETADENDARPFWKRKWFAIVLVTLVVLAVVILITWTQRLVIADRYVQEYLDDLGVNASYEIVDLGVKRQHLRNIRIGDPQQPDLVIDDLVVITAPQLSGILVDEIRVKGVRLFGEWRDDRLHFGVLDQFIYTDSDAPLALPDLTVAIDDARAKIGTPYGAIGLSAKGEGHLLDGFEGDVALIAKNLDFDSCKLAKPSAYLSISIDSLQPRITGPLRFNGLDCPILAAGSGDSGLQTDIVIARDLDAAELSLVGELDQAFYRLDNKQSIEGSTIRIATKGDIDAASFDGEAEMNITALSSPWADAGSAKLDVAMTDELPFDSLGDLSSLSLAYRLSADNVAAKGSGRNALASYGEGFEATPIGSLWAKILPVLERSAASSRLSVSGNVDDSIITADSATLREGDNRLITRVQDVRYSLRKGGIAGLQSFGFAFVHPQLPRLSGNWQGEGNRPRMTLEMPEYRSGNASLLLERTIVTLSPNNPDRISFDGAMRLDGPLAGGSITGARIPLSGTLVDGSRYYASNGGCQSIGFTELNVSTLAAGRQSLTFCPKGRQPLLAFGDDGLVINAQSQALAIDATLGGSPLSIAADGVDIGYPAISNISNLRVLIGDVDSGTSFSAGTLSMSGGSDLVGEFDGANAFIGNIPLLLSDGQGEWSFANSVLDISSNSWTVSDRAEAQRFNPLTGRNINLVLENSIILAKGDLYLPDKPDLISSVSIVHNLENATGGADVIVPGISFSENLQPNMLTDLTIGIVELANGSVSGTGRIDWDSDNISSTGKFGTDGLDFAAAFGPVKGLKGDIVFSDLLAFETPPGQIVTLDEVNPGIAAYDGIVRYQLLANQRVVLEEAHWPFSGGDLSLEPTTFNLAIPEERELNFEMKGLDAAAFLTQFDFENLAATGTFDGRLPMRFNLAGGRIEGGRLVVGPAGGTLSYIGELTYEDLGAYGNFAFQSLRDIRYKTLVVEMDGPLDGELVTRVQFDGLSQGDTASRNFLTKQIAKLPIQFNINIRAPFFQLITSTRSLYDTNYLLDPVSAGILSPKKGVILDQDTGNNQPE
jgi:hypothetical protein